MRRVLQWKFLVVGVCSVFSYSISFFRFLKKLCFKTVLYKYLDRYRVGLNSMICFQALLIGAILRNEKIFSINKFSIGEQRN